MSTGFDRLRPRTPRGGGASRAALEVRPSVPSALSGPPATPRPRDPLGRAALFSVPDPAAAPDRAGATVSVECPRCGTRSVLGPLAFVRAAVPGVHLPLLRRGSFMRCPACRRVGRLAVSLRGLLP